MFIKHGTGDAKQTVGYTSIKSGNRSELEIRIGESKAN